ncbi:MAG: response regulator transcription factor [Elusimicrobiaceae bacterium]|nr:response regulator transcription factor [Elusimicrobiaceae bacterium]
MNNIMLIDDSPVFRETVKNILSRENFALSGEGSTADDAVKLLETSKTDLLLLDILMPGTSGLDIISGLKTKYPGLKILVVTALNQKPINDELSHLNVDGILYKPFDHDELVYEVNRILGN